VIFNQIKVEKDQVLLKSYAKSEESIRVLNGMPGAITVLYLPDQVIAGFYVQGGAAGDWGGGGGEGLVPF
jgi:hypothetical protein